MADKTFREKFKEINQELKQNKAMLEAIMNNIEDTKSKPHSKVKGQSKLGNMDMVYDGKTGLWKSHAVYKDDDDEE